MDEKRKSKKRIGKAVFSAAAALLLLLAVSWGIVRGGANVSCSPWTGPDTAYGEEEKVLKAVALSCLVYGCETLSAPDGTAADLLDTRDMGIIRENADIRRSDPADPSSARIDSGAFIRRKAGECRFLTDLKDERSGFYGAAFADDAEKTVWIAYAGSVTFRDAVQCVRMVTGAALSGQEKQAFALYEAVLETDELRNENYALILTGHSLGGALAAMVSYLSGCEAVTVSGADGIALGKIRAVAAQPPEQVRIDNYLTNPHTGEGSWMDLVQRMMFWGPDEDAEKHVYPANGLTENTHCLFSFVVFEDGEPKLPEEE